MRESVDARDAAEIHEIAREFVEMAGEEVDCDLIGLEEDDGLVEEMQLSLLTERVEDLISFCRMAMEDAAERDEMHRSEARRRGDDHAGEDHRGDDRRAA